MREKEKSNPKLEGGSSPLAANATRFPLPPLRGAAPRNAQRERLYDIFKKGAQSPVQIRAEISP